METSHQEYGGSFWAVSGKGNTLYLCPSSKEICAHLNTQAAFSPRKVKVFHNKTREQIPLHQNKTTARCLHTAVDKRNLTICLELFIKTTSSGT